MIGDQGPTASSFMNMTGPNGKPSLFPSSQAPVQTGKSESQQSSSTFFSDPQQAQHLSNMMEGLIGGAGQDYLEFIRNPTASPYFQNAYQGILEALKPSEAAGRQSLTDEFRAAGGGHGMTGGAHQVAAGRLEGDIYSKQMAGLTDLLTKLFPQVTNSLFAPLGETDSILNALKLQESSGSSSQSSYGFPPNSGGGGGGSIRMSGGPLEFGSGPLSGPFPQMSYGTGSPVIGGDPNWGSGLPKANPNYSGFDQGIY